MLAEVPMLIWSLNLAWMPHLKFGDGGNGQDRRQV